MTDYERAFLDSKADMENELSYIENVCIPQEQERNGGVSRKTFLLRAVCRALFILLDWAIRREHERKL